MEYELAKFICWINSDAWDELLIDETKGLTFAEYSEFAMLAMEDNRLVLVKGGRNGILFELDSEGHMILATPSGHRRVSGLLWHTHPMPTGPSDHDCGVLRLLGQEQSVVFEINGAATGTVFRAKDSGRHASAD
jgi:hypothetical protein